MSPAQQKQLDWVEQQMAIGNELVDYACPDCGEPNFCLVPASGDSFTSQVYCPHCQDLHYREVTVDGKVKAVSQPWLAN
ncbi:MAG: hypothetical protein ABFS18_02030 [Thermodesulfobacteriota bacterium]